MIERKMSGLMEKWEHYYHYSIKKNHHFASKLLRYSSTLLLCYFHLYFKLQKGRNGKKQAERDKHIC